MAYDFVGDIHACADELDELLELLGYTEEGHPDGRTLVPVGDFNDRGPHNNRVFKRVMPMFASGAAVGVIGNHCYKLRRWMNGVEVRVGPDLQLTIDEITSEGEEFTAQVREFLDGLPFTLVLNDDILVVHGGYRDGLTEKKARDLAVYGEVGGTTEDGFPVRLDDWAHEYDGPYKLIVRGHQVVREVKTITSASGALVYNLDTACAFGGKLTALRYPEMEIVQVPARRQYRTTPVPY